MKAFVSTACSFFVASTAFAQGGASEAAKTAMNGAIQVAAVSAVTGESLKKPCATGVTPACVMMGLAVAQVGLALVNARGSSKSADALASTGGPGSGGSGGYDPTTGTPTTLTPPTSGGGGRGSDPATLTGGGVNPGVLDSLTNQYNSLRESVTRAGVSVSPDGSTATMNGKSYSASSMGSASGMSSAGFSDGDISAVQDALKDVGPKAQARLKGLAAMTNDAGRGGGKGSSSGDEYAGGGGGSDHSAFAGLSGKGTGGAKAPAVAGMSKKLGDDNIGVSGDNIFEMITRRYQARDKANAFLKD